MMRWGPSLYEENFINLLFVHSLQTYFGQLIFFSCFSNHGESICCKILLKTPIFSEIKVSDLMAIWLLFLAYPKKSHFVSLSLARVLRLFHIPLPINTFTYYKENWEMINFLQPYSLSPIVCLEKENIGEPETVLAGIYSQCNERVKKIRDVLA